MDQVGDDAQGASSSRVRWSTTSNPTQLDNPSPCDGWTVRDVLNHITGGAEMFALCVRDGSVPDESSAS